MADDILKEAQDAFELIAEAEGDNRTAWADDVDFALNEEQWPEKVRRARELEGRPCLTINKLAAMGRQVVNDARQNKPGIVVHPADSEADPETAEVFNGLIRNIEVSSNAEVAYDTALEHAVFGGFGYFRINTAYTSDDTFEQDIVIERIANPLSVYGDCYSTAADSSDWNTAFITDSLTKKQFAKQYKGADPVNWQDDAWQGVNAPWLDGDNVMVAEYWTREETKRRVLMLSNQEMVAEDEFKKNAELYQALGIEPVGQPREVMSHKVTQRVLSGAEELNKIEWAGRYIPIIPVYGSEVNFKGKRSFRSLVRGAKDAQRMFNYWRTASTELVALAPKAPFIGRKGAFETDSAKWATANSQAHAFLEYDGSEKPERQPFAGVPAGALQEALNASDDIKAALGIYDASLGARSNETSGKAITARQLEGDTATFHFIDNLSRAIRHAGRVLIDLIPQVYSVPQVVRIMGPEGEPEMVKVNQPTTIQRENPETGEMEAIEHIYDLGAGKYDLVVKAGPSFNTRREQSVEALIQIMQSVPESALVLGDIVAKNLDMPEADEIGKRLKVLADKQLGIGEQPQTPEGTENVPHEVIQQVQEQMGQLQQQAQAMAAENAALKQDQTNKAEELRIKAFEADTARIVAEKPTPAPKAAQAA